jgi:hypothetical protein
VVPIAVLTDLVAEGLPAEQATREVFALAREGRADADFVALRRQAQADRKRNAGRAQPERPVSPPAPEPPTDR